MDPNLNRDIDLWKKAHERAGFKMHLIVYLIVIAFLWVLWAFLRYVNNTSETILWPLFPMIGWGLGVLLHYLIVFSWKQKITQREYEKLLKKRK